MATKSARTVCDPPIRELVRATGNPDLFPSCEPALSGRRATRSRQPTRNPGGRYPLLYWLLVSSAAGSLRHQQGVVLCENLICRESVTIPGWTRIAAPCASACLYGPGSSAASSHRAALSPLRTSPFDNSSRPTLGPRIGPGSISARRVHGPEVAHGSDTPRSEAVRRCEGVYVTYSLEGYGKCTFEYGACATSNDEDCKEAVVCTGLRQCTARGGKCVKKP